MPLVSNTDIEDLQHCYLILGYLLFNCINVIWNSNRSEKSARVVEEGFTPCGSFALLDFIAGLGVLEFLFCSLSWLSHVCFCVHGFSCLLKRGGESENRVPLTSPLLL